MAGVTGGVSSGQFGLDYKFAFSIHNYKSVPLGEMVSNTFTHNGNCWQLEVKKIKQTYDVVNVDCQLLLVTANSKNGKLARISVCFTGKESQSSHPVVFYQSGDKCNIQLPLCPTGAKDLRVELEVLKTIESVRNDAKDLTKHLIEPPKPQMATVLLKWFQSEDFGDVTIVAADGHKFRCHKDILTARSDVFGRMFNSPMREWRENLVDIENCDWEIVFAMLRFVYTDQCGGIGLIADRLYVAAHQYELDGLKILCEYAMAANLSANSIAKVYRLAAFYHLDKLVAICVDYLDNHKAEISMLDVLAEMLKIQ